MNKTKEEILITIKKRIDEAFSDGCHNHEKDRLIRAIGSITELIPPDRFDNLSSSHLTDQIKSMEVQVKELREGKETYRELYCDAINLALKRESQLESLQKENERLILKA